MERELPRTRLRSALSEGMISMTHLRETRLGAGKELEVVEEASTW